MILVVLLVQNVVPLFVLLLVQNVVLHVMLLLVQNLARRNLISAKNLLKSGSSSLWNSALAGLGSAGVVVVRLGGVVWWLGWLGWVGGGGACLDADGQGKSCRMSRQDLVWQGQITHCSGAIDGWVVHIRIIYLTVSMPGADRSFLTRDRSLQAPPDEDTPSV